MILFPKALSYCLGPNIPPKWVSVSSVLFSCRMTWLFLASADIWKLGVTCFSNLNAADWTISSLRFPPSSNHIQGKKQKNKQKNLVLSIPEFPLAWSNILKILRKSLNENFFIEETETHLLSAHYMPYSRRAYVHSQ